MSMGSVRVADTHLGLSGFGSPHSSLMPGYATWDHLYFVLFWKVLCAVLILAPIEI